MDFWKILVAIAAAIGGVVAFLYYFTGTLKNSIELVPPFLKWLGSDRDKKEWPPTYSEFLQRKRVDFGLAKGGLDDTWEVRNKDQT